MYFNFDYKNDFVTWAKSNQLDADYEKYEILKQYATFDNIENKELWNPYKDESEADFIIIPREQLAEDKAIIRFAGSCKNVKLLGKYPAIFQWPERRFFSPMEKPRADVFESMAASFMINNLSNYNAVLDRNTNKVYLFTTFQAWEEFKKYYANYLEKLKQDFAQCKKEASRMYKLKEETDKATREAEGKLNSVENEIFYKQDFAQYYSKLE